MTRTYTVPDDTINDLYNAMLMLRTSAESHPRMDNILHATLTYAADAMAALVDLANAQHPVEDVVLREEVLA